MAASIYGVGMFSEWIAAVVLIMIISNLRAERMGQQTNKQTNPTMICVFLL